MSKIVLIIEKGEGGFWGRVQYEDNLISEFGETVGKLADSMRQLLSDFHDIQLADITFEYQYDLTVLFEVYAELNITKVAEKAGVNPSLMRQYARGIKFPSVDQARKIETTIHKLGKELQELHLTE